MKKRITNEEGYESPRCKVRPFGLSLILCTSDFFALDSGETLDDVTSGEAVTDWFN